MRAAIETIDPDLILLQEVQGRHDVQRRLRHRWPATPQSEYIAANRWAYNLYGQNASYHSGHHGNAIVSKFPLEPVTNVNVSTMTRASRGLLHATLQYNGAHIHLICVHFGLFREERLTQAVKLTRYVQQQIPTWAPLVVAGDFNDWREELSHHFESVHNMTEAVKHYHGHYARSYPALKPTLRVDRIYFRGLELAEAGCLLGRPWRHLSDHLPVYAQFNLPRQRC